MKRYAESLARQKGLCPPGGYDTSISICRIFLNEHAAKKSGDKAAKAESPARKQRANRAGKSEAIVEGRMAGATSKTGSSSAKRAPPRARPGRKLAAETEGAANPVKARRTRKRAADRGPSEVAPTASAPVDSVADSIRQQGDRDEARRPIRRRWLVCSARNRSLHFSRTRLELRRGGGKRTFTMCDCEPSMPASKILVRLWLRHQQRPHQNRRARSRCRCGRLVVSRHRAYADGETPDCADAAAGLAGNRVGPSPKAESRLAAFVKAISRDTRRDPL